MSFKSALQIQLEDRKTQRKKSVLEIYKDPLRGLSIDNTWRIAKEQFPGMKREEVEEILSQEPTVEKFRQYKKPVYRAKTLWEPPGAHFQMDLAQVVGYKQSYLLNIIDVGSRYAFSYYLTNKSAATVRDSIARFLEADYVPVFGEHLPTITLKSDFGTEFWNETLKKFLADFGKKKGITLFIDGTTSKPALIERFNRTLKLLIRNAQLVKLGMTLEEVQAKGEVIDVDAAITMRAQRMNYDFINELPLLLQNYNTRVHSFFKQKMSPAQAVRDPHAALEIIFPEALKASPAPKFAVGDRVLVSQHKINQFQKESALMPTFANPSTISRVFFRENENGALMPVYFLKDKNGNVANGMYYETDLRKINA